MRRRTGTIRESLDLETLRTMQMLVKTIPTGGTGRLAPDPQRVRAEAGVERIGSAKRERVGAGAERSGGWSKTRREEKGRDGFAELVEPLWRVARLGKEPANRVFEELEQGAFQRGLGGLPHAAGGAAYAG